VTIPIRGSLATALALLAAGCGGGAPTEAGEAGTRQLVLHPPDLARGYQYGDDTSCGGVSASEGEWPRLEPLFAQERPDACQMELQWVWEGEPRYSRLVTSAAYVFDDADGARRAYEARDELAFYAAALRVRERGALDLGDEGELLRGDGANNPASGVAWRDGKVVAVLVLEPGKDKAARALAAKQQERIEHPAEPRPEPPENDPELQLDDPALELPVYWLGRTLDPPGELPPAELELATVGGSGPGQSVQLWYRVGGDVPDTLTLDTWVPEAWERFRRTRLGRLVWDSPCARKEIVPVAGGRAEIFLGYGAPNPVQRPCPARPHDRVVAHVYYQDVVVAVNMPYCYECARPEPRPSPYTTPEATDEVVRSLRLRTPRRR
jgi:hypothetical protein